MQEIFHMPRPLFLSDAVHANDLSSFVRRTNDEDDDGH
jgi:hypothetical protein